MVNDTRLPQEIEMQREQRIRELEQRLAAAEATISLLLEGPPDAVVQATTASPLLRQAQDALLKSEQKLRAIFENALEAMVIASDDAIFLDANPAAEKLLGASRDEIVGQGIRHFLAQEDSFDKRWQHFRQEGHERGLIALRRPDGAIRYAEYSAVAHFIPGQNLSVLRDVTERRRTQEMVQQQERLAAVGQLAAGIAHDFNNVMSAIVLYAQILQRRDDLSDKERRRLDIIYRQANHAIDLIKQILDFSRRSVMERSAMDLVPFFKEMFRLFEHTLPESIKLALHYQAPDYIVVADPTRLQQAIMNLAINARDAMPDGGSFTVSLSRLELLPENMPPAPDMAPGPWLRISVADEGYGMSEEIMQHVFEPFYTTKGSSRGTGLGLAQVYGIIRQHDGYITVDSIEGRGTTFTIYLPLIEEDTQATEMPPPTFDQAPRAPREATVLLVEDEEWARIAVQESLEALGYHVLAATNGQEALDIFAHKKRHIDLVLSDMVMPQMGGLVLYEQIRAQRPQMKMVLMSGYPLQDAGRTLLERGAVDWIAKPFSVNDLAQKVAEMIAGG